MNDFACFVLFAVLAAVAAGLCFILCKVFSDDIVNLRGRAETVTAPYINRAADSERSSGCVFGTTGIYLDGNFDRYARNCLLECTPSCLCCVTLLAGEPYKQYTVTLDGIEHCKVRKCAKGYKVTMTAGGRKSIFAVHKRSPRGIIPQQAERVEKFIDILCKAAGVDSSQAA